MNDFVSGAGDAPRLTPRERELAGLVAQGLDNAQIAARLGVADKSVRNALSALYAKLGVDGRARAVARSGTSDCRSHARQDIRPVLEGEYPR